MGVKQVQRIKLKMALYSFQRNFCHHLRVFVQHGIINVTLQIHLKPVASTITKIHLKFTKVILKKGMFKMLRLCLQEDWQPCWPQHCVLYFTLPLARNLLDGTKQ